tara:strand:+ start:18 stop:458 length:441 start_codon:yes stop_codon:yes gene_type:complete
MPIKSFRGKLTDGDIDTISLHTNNGSIGYKIIKFQTMPATPGNATQESVMKIFKVPQTTTTATVDFADNTLLAAALYKQEANASQTAQGDIVIFDNEIFNQDIFITHKDAATGEQMNYYIELEQIKLALDQNTVATLKDIRNIESQ